MKKAIQPFSIRTMIAGSTPMNQTNQAQQPNQTRPDQTRLIFRIPFDLLPIQYGEHVEGEPLTFDVFRAGVLVQTYTIEKLSSFHTELQRGVILVSTQCRSEGCTKSVDGRMPFRFHNGHWWANRLPNAHCLQHATGGGNFRNRYRVRVGGAVFWQSPELAD